MEHIRDGIPLNQISKPLPLDVLRASARATAALNMSEICPFHLSIRQYLIAHGAPDSFTRYIPLWWAQLAWFESKHGGQNIGYWIQLLALKI